MIAFSLILLCLWLVIALAFALLAARRRRRESARVRASARRKWEPFDAEREQRRILDRTQMLSLRDLGRASLVLIAFGLCARASAQDAPSLSPAPVPVIVRIGEPARQEIVSGVEAAGVKAGPMMSQTSAALIPFTPDASLFRLVIEPAFLLDYDPVSD